MNPAPLLAFAALALLAVPAVAADPPGTCLFGYNPDSLSNVCYQASPGTTVHAGTVGTSSMEVCPIGNICEDVPVPTYTPGGGTGVPVPGAMTPTYVSVAGIEVYPGYATLTPCSEGTSAADKGYYVGEECVTPRDATNVARDCLNNPECAGTAGDLAQYIVDCVRFGNCVSF